MKFSRKEGGRTNAGPFWGDKSVSVLAEENVSVTENSFHLFYLVLRGNIYFQVKGMGRNFVWEGVWDLQKGDLYKQKSSPSVRPWSFPIWSHCIRHLGLKPTCLGCHGYGLFDNPSFPSSYFSNSDPCTVTLVSQTLLCHKSGKCRSPFVQFYFVVLELSFGCERHLWWGYLWFLSEYFNWRLTKIFCECRFSLSFFWKPFPFFCEMNS